MFITGLNRLFAKHGKIAFTVILVIIIVTFVFYFSPGHDIFGIIAGRSRTADFLKGKGISEADLSRQVNYVLLQNMLMFPQISLNNEGYRQYAAQQAVEDITLLRIAARRGITAGDDAVVRKLEAARALQKDGKFSKDEYERFVKEKLLPFNLSKEDLDEAVRQQAVIESLEKDIKAGVISSQDEIRAAFDLENEKIKARKFKYSAKDFLAEVKPDDASVQSYFNANAGNYKISPKFKAEIVRFNYLDYGEKAAAEVKEDDVKAHYEKNKNKYKEKNEIQPLEKVAEKIKAELSEAKAKDLAVNDAHSFAGEAYDLTEKLDDRSKCVDEFRKLAETKKIKTYELDWISSEDKDIKRVGEEPELSAEISKLISDSPVSNAVRGAKAAFVACLIESKPERKAEFDEVKEKVEQDFKDEKAAILAREKARDARVEVAAALEKGGKMEEIEKQFKSEDIKEFVASMNPPGDDGAIVKELAGKTRPEKLSEVVDTQDGALFIYVEKKTMPTSEDFKKKEESFSRRYKMQKENAVWTEFIKAHMKPLEDAAPKDHGRG